MLRGYFYGPQREQLYVLIKLQHGERSILREKEVYTALQEKKAEQSAESTGCVYMFPSPHEYLVVEEFGSDIRAYFNPNSSTLIPNLKKLMSTVATLHSFGFVHCDIKPAYVLVRVGAFGIVEFKLCDLDSATAIGEEFPLGKFTKAWVSPEVYFCSLKLDPLRVSPAIDSYGLGLLIAGMLSADCQPSKMVLPADNDAEFIEVLSNQEKLNRLLECSLKPYYKPIVEMACR